MKLTYLFNSGFLLECNNFNIIIDYYSAGSKGSGEFLNQIITAGITDENKDIYVLVSHQHRDHFDPIVLDWSFKRNDIKYIFSDDIMPFVGVKQNIYFIKQGESYNDPLIKITAFGSTDEGISFLLESEACKIFHAGDLNNWHWRDEVSKEEADVYEQKYLNEVYKIKFYTDYVDLAMFPVDPRLGKEYMDGGKQFISNIKTKMFVPMHFGGKYESANKFSHYAQQYGTDFWSIDKKGAYINILEEF